MKKILMFTESNISEDERIIKTCMTLSSLGFIVHVIYPLTNKNSKELFSHKNIFLHPFQLSNFFFNKLSASCLLQPFYFKLWKTKAKKILNIEKIELIYVHDLPLSKVGKDLSNKYNTKIVLDQHEYYSEWIKKAKHLNTKIGKLIFNLSNWAEYEKKYLSTADLVVSVTENLCNKYIERIPVLKNKIVSLPNTPLKSIYSKSNLNSFIINNFKKNQEFRVIYIGANISEERGVSIMIDAIPSIIIEIPDFKFMVLGNLHSSYDILSHIKKNKVEKYVEIIGRVPVSEVASYIACSSIGVNLHNTHSIEIDNTIPTKIFQYIAMETPIISTDCKMVSTLVLNNSIGQVIKNTPEALARSVIEILTDKNLKNNYVANLSKIDTLFWRNTSKNWQDSMNQLLNV